MFNTRRRRAASLCVRELKNPNYLRRFIIKMEYELFRWYI